MFLIVGCFRFEVQTSQFSWQRNVCGNALSQLSVIKPSNSTSPKMAMFREVNGTIPMAPDQRLETLMVTDATRTTVLRHFSVRFCNVLDVTLMRMSQCPLDAGVHSVMVKPTSLGFADRASRRAVWISVTQIDNTDLDENKRRMRGKPTLSFKMKRMTMKEIQNAGFSLCMQCANPDWAEMRDLVTRTSPTHQYWFSMEWFMLLLDQTGLVQEIDQTGLAFWSLIT